ncbi:hypothetical protein P8452_32507 [Trifolium repens]|nr:hypothetical protein P8452_32507 [Trifolium repens]
MARVKMSGVKIRKSRTSSSSTRSPSPPSATSPPKNSGNKSSSNTSFKTLSDHYNEAEIESSNPEIHQNPVNTVQSNLETVHATQSQNQNIVTSQILIGTVPINIETISAVETINVEPIQCSQTNIQTKIVTPPPIIKTTAFTKTVSTSKNKKSKSKSFDSSTTSTTFTLTNVGRMKRVSEIEDHTVNDQGLKRKREAFENPEPENLKMLADVVTTQ